MKNIKSTAKTNELSTERYKQLKNFCKPLRLYFKDYLLLELAFHHKSSSNEFHGIKHYNNERLEFLGDSVLGMVTATFLYKTLPEHTEGELSKIKSSVVSEKALAPIALKFGIDKMLVMGKGAKLNNEERTPSILADCMEAIIGAYYLDQGYENTEKYVLSFIEPEVKKVLANQGIKDYKSMLQEFSQKFYQKCPVYELVGKSGPDHDQIFSVAVHIQEKVFGPVSGKTKKQAEQNVAKVAWEYLNKK